MQVLQGSFVAIVTPFKKNGEVDYAALENLIDWHIDEGTNGIVSVGTTGESATLSIYEHIDVIEHTVKYVNKKLPVIAGTGANSTQEAIDLSLEAKLKGADYTLLVTPYYNKPNQNGLIAHYEKIADTVEMGHILYNVPSRTACDLMPKTVDILSSHKNIVAIKEAVDDMKRIKELVDISKKHENFSVLSGDDPTFANAISIGAHGVISVAANVIPKDISKICLELLNNNKDIGINLNNKYKNLYDLLFLESNPIPVKWMLYKMNLIQRNVRLPLVQLDETYHEKILSELYNLELLS
jgi:4-hydroxy-tetrahydrodipicolinate synthase